jgi:hypothetical protein
MLIEAYGVGGTHGLFENPFGLGFQCRRGVNQPSNIYMSCPHRDLDTIQFNFSFIGPSLPINFICLTIGDFNEQQRKD